jgi:hypothetical protein
MNFWFLIFSGGALKTLGIGEGTVKGTAIFVPDCQWLSPALCLESWRLLSLTQLG